MTMAKNGKLLVAMAVAGLSVGSMSAQALDLDKLTLRVRVIDIIPADKSDAIPALAIPADSIDVKAKLAPDIDFEYALADNWALELLLTIPQRHDVVVKESALGRNVNVGSVQHLPPTLTAKYYFATKTIKPYIGAGVNFTWFTDSDLANIPGVGQLSISRTSVGPALQAGIDVTISDKWSLSFDAKKAWISTDLKLNGSKIASVDVNPYIFGMGAGYRF